jgi:ABC-type phosphate/phosphonate transport system substrate-binding protein
VDEDLRDKFAAAFLSLDSQNEAHKTVLDLQGAERFVGASSSDFDAIETVARSTGLLQ